MVFKVYYQFGCTNTPHTHCTHSQLPRMLHSVILFDSFLKDYDITDSTLIVPSAGPRKLTPQAKSEAGVGILLNQKLNRLDKIQIKVCCCLHDIPCLFTFMYA